MPLIPIDTADCVNEETSGVVLIELQGKFETNARELDGLEVGDFEISTDVVFHPEIYSRIGE